MMMGSFILLSLDNKACFLKITREINPFPRENDLCYVETAAFKKIIALLLPYTKQLPSKNKSTVRFSITYIQFKLYNLRYVFYAFVAHCRRKVAFC